MKNSNDEILMEKLQQINTLILQSVKNYTLYLKKFFTAHLDVRSLNYIVKNTNEAIEMQINYLNAKDEIKHIEKHSYDSVVNLFLGLQFLTEPLFDFDDKQHCQLLYNLFDNIDAQNNLLDIEKIHIQFQLPKTYSAEINTLERVNTWKDKVNEYLSLT